MPISPPLVSASRQRLAHRSAAVSLIALIVLCLAWELVLAPLRPTGSWLALKALPLCLPLAGVLKGRLYTLQWASMMILLYLTEGVVRALSDRGPSAAYAALEAALSIVFFVAAVAYVAPHKRAAKARAAQIRAASSAASPASAHSEPT
jgi:uncharacterized membrane protein